MDVHLNNEFSFPVLYTVEGSSDHGVLFINPFDPLDGHEDDIANQLMDADDRNNGEHAGETVTVQCLAVVWDRKSQASGFPEKTYVTEQNYKTLFRLLSQRRDKDDRLHAELADSDDKDDDAEQGEDD